MSEDKSFIYICTSDRKGATSNSRSDGMMRERCGLVWSWTSVAKHCFQLLVFQLLFHNTALVIDAFYRQ